MNLQIWLRQLCYERILKIQLKKKNWVLGLTSHGVWAAGSSPGWVEGIRLSDGERGWFPKTYVEEITSRSARLRNLRENIRIKCVTQKLQGGQ